MPHLRPELQMLKETRELERQATVELGQIITRPDLTVHEVLLWTCGSCRKR